MVIYCPKLMKSFSFAAVYGKKYLFHCMIILPTKVENEKSTKRNGSSKVVELLLLGDI